MLSKITKNFLLISSLLILSWIGMMFSRWFSDNGALEKQLLSHLESAAQGKAAEISSYLDERKNDLAFLASLPYAQEDLKNKELSDKTKEALEHFKENKEYIDLILIDTEGKILWTAGNMEFADVDLTSPDQEKTKLGEVYRKVKRDFGAGVFDPGYYGQDDKLSIFITTPVLIDSPHVSGKKDMVGILAAQIDNGNIEEKMGQDAGLGDVGRIYLVNRKGTPLVPVYDFEGKQITHIDTELKKNCFRDYDNYYISSQNQGVYKAPRRGLFKDYLGRDSFGAHKYILQNGWCVLAEADKENYLKAVELSAKKNEFKDGLIILSGLSVLFLIWFVLNRFFIDTEYGSFLHCQWRVNAESIRCNLNCKSKYK